MNASSTRTVVFELEMDGPNVRVSWSDAFLVIAAELTRTNDR